MRYYLLIGLLLVTPVHAATIYVKSDATGANNGTSWADAYTDLQDALASATGGDEIWVAAGTYKPTSSTDRSISFELVEGTALYGGFDGTETLLSQRDVTLNVTTLSGDIGAPSDSTDNSYQVVRADTVSASTLIDGFTVTGGNAEGLMSFESNGGGMFVISSPPMVSNVVFYRNRAKGSGGGLAWLHGSGETMTTSNLSFIENTAYTGGGLRSTSELPEPLGRIIIAGATFTGNTAGLGSGAAELGKATITNSTFTDNTALNSHGALSVVDTAQITDCEFTGNTCTIGPNGACKFGTYHWLTRCTFTDNTSGDGGAYDGPGAIGGSFGTITECVFTGNSTSGSGGAILASGDYEIIDCTFDNNSAGAEGGGIFAIDALSVTGTVIRNNSAQTGAGIIFCDEYSLGGLALESVLIIDNTASGTGGGIVNEFASVTLVNVAMVGNSAADAGGMYSIESTVTGTNVTIAGNDAPGGSGGGLLSHDSSMDFANLIVWGNSAATGPNVDNTGTTVTTFRYSNIEGSGGSGAWNPAFGIDGGNNIDGDPLFIDLPGGDAQLGALSPSIDAGDPHSIPGLPPTDLAGNPRVQGTTVDQGAYEAPDSTATAVDDTPSNANRFALLQNDPNPFNPVTTIRYDLAQPAWTSLVIYDVSGRYVRTLVNEAQPAGRHDAGWDATDGRGHRVSSGVYFYRLIAGSFSDTRKMVLLR